MKKEYLSYSKKVAGVGETIEKGANIFGEGARIEGNSKEVFQRKRDTYEKGLGWYRRGMEQIVNVNPPQIIVNEHRDLTRSVQQLIDSSVMMLDSVNVDNFSYDEHLHRKRSNLQAQAVKNVEIAANKIIEKFQKN